MKILKTGKFETRSACDKRFRVELNAVDPAGRNKNDQMTKQKSDAFQDQMGKLDVPTFGQKEVGRANWEYQEQRPRSSRVWQWIRRGRRRTHCPAWRSSQTGRSLGRKTSSVLRRQRAPAAERNSAARTSTRRKGGRPRKLADHCEG